MYLSKPVKESIGRLMDEYEHFIFRVGKAQNDIEAIKIIFEHLETMHNLFGWYGTRKKTTTQAWKTN